MISQPIKEMRISSFTPRVVTYNRQKINLTYFSPYFQIQLLPTGFKLWNTRLGKSISLRIKSEQMNTILSFLDNGVQDEMLIDAFNRYGIDGQRIVNELMLKGIIE